MPPSVFSITFHDQDIDRGSEEALQCERLKQELVANLRKAHSPTKVVTSPGFTSPGGQVTKQTGSSSEADAVKTPRKLSDYQKFSRAVMRFLNALGSTKAKGSMQKAAQVRCPLRVSVCVCVCGACVCAIQGVSLFGLYIKCWQLRVLLLVIALA